MKYMFIYNSVAAYLIEVEMHLIVLFSSSMISKCIKGEETEVPGKRKVTGTEQKKEDSDGEHEDSPAARARQQLEALLNKTMRIRMTDGRTLVGCFLCTDRDCNVILGSAQEFLKPSDSFSAGEPRVLGLAMVPGHHIVSIEVQRESLAGSPYL
ncbi:N-alpha-acetyltransferase 38, NatC auxiliary subunit isoform X2 [Cavia porcellus]|uniref:N-alpha-acetyltransferase 38, NatC auxiliary subunit isoform X2 n=1 Tax=Cavia porcellus TaxID=10141 RepID=UPI002FE20C4C